MSLKTRACTSLSSSSNSFIPRNRVRGTTCREIGTDDARRWLWSTRFFGIPVQTSVAEPAFGRLSIPNYGHFCSRSLGALEGTDGALQFVGQVRWQVHCVRQQTQDDGGFAFDAENQKMLRRAYDCRRQATMIEMGALGRILHRRTRTSQLPATAAVTPLRLRIFCEAQRIRQKRR